MDCIFCKIVAGAVPAEKVYEDEHNLAFLDIHPHEKGHTLVIPKSHYTWVWDVEDIGSLYKAVKIVANAQKKAFATELVVSLVFGKNVPHAHVQLIPAKDTPEEPTSVDMLLHRISYADGEMYACAEKIRKFL